MPRVQIHNENIGMFDACGIEIECDFITADDFSNFGDGNFRPTHDASCETDVRITNTFGNMILTVDENCREYVQTHRRTVGVELVSNILNSSNDEEMLNLIKKVCNFMAINGEPSESLRSGIHFHFSLPNPNLRILKSIVRLGRNLESLFFTIGGMGYEFRGIKNDSTYCRPITKFGPPCIKLYGGGYAQVFRVKDLLMSQSVDEFWYKYGDLFNHGGRYNPVRYTWLNLYPLFPHGEYKGTLEFRIFNKTLNPLFIMATLMLCKKFTEYAVASSFRSLKEDSLLGENSVYDPIKKYELADILNNFVNLVELDQKYIKILFDILQRATIPNLKNEYVHTHLNRDLRDYWGESLYGYVPDKIRAEDIKKPQYTDIHTLRGE